MSSRLSVDLRKPRQRNLKADYLPDPDLIFAENTISEYDPVGGDHFSIELHIVFDVDRDLYAAQIEFIFPRRAWQVKDGLTFPMAHESADIRFSQAQIDERTHESDVLKVYSDRERRIVSVDLSEEVTHPTYVALGDNIVAVLDSEMLSGFVMRLY